MDKNLFAQLAESLRQATEISHGKREASRTFEIDQMHVKEVRAATGLSQENFARVINVQVSTLRNWEQGRRYPTGPARALLTAIRNDPQRVLKALAQRT